MVLSRTGHAAPTGLAEKIGGVVVTINMSLLRSWPNPAHALDGWIPSRLIAGHHWPAASDEHRWRLDHAMKAILPRASALVLALAVSVASCGCAGVSAGHRIGADTIAFITPGITTKQEVLENLGSPLFDLEGGRLIAYYWETTGQLKVAGT